MSYLLIQTYIEKQNIESFIDIFTLFLFHRYTSLEILLLEICISKSNSIILHENCLGKYTKCRLYNYHDVLCYIGP